MQKAEFLKKLSDVLSESCEDPGAVKNVLDRFTEHLDALPADELQSELDDGTDIESLAKALLNAYRKEPVSKDKPDTPTIIDLQPDLSQTTVTPRVSPSRVRSVSNATTTDDTIIVDVVSKSSRTTGNRSTYSAISSASDPSKKTARPTSSAIKYSELDNVIAVDNKNQILFWVVVALLSPIILGVLALIVGLFLFVFLAMATVIAGAIAALVGVVCAGTGITLFGLIYGTTQLFSVPSAGLYEIGVAAIVSGCSLFVGILLYNLAIRLMPYLMKKFGVFVRFAIRKGYLLFQFIRRECTGK